MGIAKAKTRKSVAKRFKLTASGKIKANHAGRRHLAATKNRKRKRHLAKSIILADSDENRIKQNLPFA